MPLIKQYSDHHRYWHPNLPHRTTVDSVSLYVLCIFVDEWNSCSGTMMMDREGWTWPTESWSEVQLVLKDLRNQNAEPYGFARPLCKKLIYSDPTKILYRILLGRLGPHALGRRAWGQTRLEPHSLRKSLGLDWLAFLSDNHLLDLRLLRSSGLAD